MFSLTGDAPEAAELFGHAATLLGGRDPRDLVRTAPDEAIHADRPGQILCTLQALAAAAALRGTFPPRLVIAGYSVGEVAAWGVAGAFTPADTLDLIARRAEAMDAASSPGEGMLFVRGLPRATLQELCGRHDAAIAIVNPGDAFVVGGDGPQLKALGKEAVSAARTHVITLPVRVASHTPRLAAASVAFREILRPLPVTLPGPGRVRLLSGIDGAPVLAAEPGLDKLAAQISQTVRWSDCLQACVEAGATAFLELGPGAGLARMAAGAFPDVPARPPGCGTRPASERGRR
ncbi:acyltransferase domain-containing protein, partial [Hansschlegelia beijingensis]|uniref:acyltransferase domain-containing protein n=1 Tax=Hansschlegelia beijingensis TaxID=1133344 RepID=UPI00387F0510